jgi:hypothetical protein
VKGLHPTLSKKISLESSSTTEVARPKPQSPAAPPLAINGKKQDFASMTSMDQFALAKLLGEGDIERGYLLIGRLNEAEANDLAVWFRRDRSSVGELRTEAAQLEENFGRFE